MQGPADGYGRRPEDAVGDTLSPPGVIIQGGQVIRYQTRLWFPGAPFNQNAIPPGGSVLIVGPNDVPPGADRAEFRLTVPITGVYRFFTSLLIFGSPGIDNEQCEIQHNCTPADSSGLTLQRSRTSPAQATGNTNYIPVELESYWRLVAGTLYVLQASMFGVSGGANWFYYVDPDLARAALTLADVVTG